VAEGEDRDDEAAADVPDDEPESEQDDDSHRRRRRLERLLPGVIKRAIEKGIETGIGSISQANDSIRKVVDKTELPKEVAGYVFSQVDDTRNAVVRVVAREVREFLEAADLAKELQKVLTTLSFEIRTEIRFVPNDAGGITPDVKAQVGPRVASERTRPRAERRRRGARRPSAEVPEDEGNDPEGDR
jgi:hypothetical protein